MRVAIIGAAGGVGSATAFALTLTGAVEELVLIDDNERAVRSHVMDLEQLTVDHPLRVRAGSLTDAAGAQVTILSASVPHRDGAPREAFLRKNARVVDGIATRLVEVPGWGGKLVIVTNPVDPLCTWIDRRLGRGLVDVLGYTLNDTTRLRFAVAAALGVEASRVEAWSIGQHGDYAVPLFSRIRVDGTPVQLDHHQRGRVLRYIRSWYQRWQDCRSGRTSTWMTGSGLAQLIRAVAHPSDRPHPVSVPLRGEYGMASVSLTVPVLLGPERPKVLEWELAPDEMTALHEGAAAIAAAVESVEQEMTSSSSMR